MHMKNLLEKTMAIDTLARAGDEVLCDLLRKERKRGHVRFSKHKLLRQAAEARAQESSLPLREIPSFRNNLRSYVGHLRSALKEGTHNCHPLHVVLLKKPDGGKRPLMVHKYLEDKIIERAVYIVVREILREQLDNGVSYCGIPTLNRKQRAPGVLDAHIRLARFMREKRWWILKADIASFFDSLRRQEALALLKKHLPDDSLQPFFESWIQVSFDNPAALPEGHNPKIGIPQGSCLSPLVANLYLYNFDEIRKKLGVELLRYADDLAIVCTSEDRLLTERKRAESDLKAVGLVFKEKKVKSHRPDDDMDFLGYRHTLGKVHVEDTKISEWIERLGLVFRMFLSVANRMRAGKPMRPKDIETLKKARKMLYEKLGGYSEWMLPARISCIVKRHEAQKHASRMGRYLASACHGINRIAGRNMLEMCPFIRTMRDPMDNLPAHRVWPYVVPRIVLIIDHDQL